jgi:FAD synthetase
MRVLPILFWEYSDVWDYIKKENIPYCPLYKEGYTSIGGRRNTIPNPALKLDDGTYRHAAELEDGSLERLGRVKSKSATVAAEVRHSEEDCPVG